MKKGFTLIELLAVVLIMGILTAVALPQYRKSVERARVAEAVQMLPVIYDARDRLITEQGLVWPSDRLSALFKTPTWASKVTFSKLDVDFKGKPGTSTHSWETDNCTYGLFTIGKSVSAVLTKGAYRGTSLYYDGSSVTCCGAAGICEDMLNMQASQNCAQLATATPVKDGVSFSKWADVGTVKESKEGSLAEVALP